MPRNRGHGRSSNRGGHNNFRDDNSWASRGTQNAKGAQIPKSGGRGRRNRHHRRNSNPWRLWQDNHHHRHGAADSTCSDFEADVSDCGVVNLGQFPPADDSVFEFLLSSKPRAGASATKCSRPDCNRAKKDLILIRHRDKQLRRALVKALNVSGQKVVDFIYGEGFDDEDAESMDWVPEPTVNLIVSATPTPEPLSPVRQMGRGTPCDPSSHLQKEHQLPADYRDGDGCTVHPGLDGHGQATAGNPLGPQPSDEPVAMDSPQRSTDIS